MNKNLKFKESVQKDRSTVEQVKAQTFHVQTGLSAGWVPGQNVRNKLQDVRQSMPAPYWDPNKV